jgi:NTP pyrophosphatase (non-canonical NTP hydrolase)
MKREDQPSICSWADRSFGETEALGCAIRANEEMSELLSALRDWDGDLKNEEIPIEAADVMIVLMRLFEIFGVDYQDVIDRKMRKNRRRKWKRTGTGHGYHV